MKKYKSKLPKIITLNGFELPQEIKDIQCKDRKNRNKVEIKIYDIENYNKG